MSTIGDGDRRNLGDASDKRRFWKKVSRDPASGCWNWVGGKFATGYGAFGMNGTTWLAHRLAYTWENGHIESGLVLDHHECSNRACVNPNHLRAVTQTENAGRETRQKREQMGSCRTEGCDRAPRSANIPYCNPCYRKKRRTNEQRTCEIPECNLPWFTRGLCSAHYTKLKATGAFETVQPKRAPRTSNYRELVEIDPKTGCWIWQGENERNGYGLVEIIGPNGERIRRAAHRVIWEELKGPLSDTVVLDHVHCQNKLCCNPDHLDPITLAENTARSSRSRAGKARQRSPRRAPKP